MELPAVRHKASGLQETGLELGARVRVCELLLEDGGQPLPAALTPQQWGADKALLVRLVQLRCQDLVEQLGAAEARLQDVISAAAAEVLPSVHFCWGSRRIAGCVVDLIVRRSRACWASSSSSQMGSVTWEAATGSQRC